MQHELDAALRAYRQDPLNAALRDALLLLLYQAVAAQSHHLITRQFGSLSHREDELVLRTLERIEARQEARHAIAPVATREAHLLADYEFRPGGRSIYGYVLQKTRDIARNMQAEAYVPDGGFWSNDLQVRFKALHLQNPAGRNPARSGAQIEVPIAAHDDDDDAPELPAALRWSETPMRQSVLRVNALAQRLDALGRDMVGKTISPGAGHDHAVTRLTVNHQRIWRAWLGLSHPDLIDLSESDLANALGVSKATVTRDTSAAFAYLLQHPGLRALLVWMEPSRFQSGAAQAKPLEAKLDELESVLRGVDGKRFFRKCVHQWLGEHV